MSDFNIKGKVYEGSPKEITLKICHEIADVLSNNGISPTGLHVIALTHVATSMIQSEMREPSGLGKMPSLKTMLRLVTHGVAGTDWSDEELAEFGEEFCQIVESLGGTRMNGRSRTEALSGMPFLSPGSKEVH